VYAASIKKLPSVGTLKPLLRLKGEVKLDHRTDFREVNPGRIVGNKEAQRMIEMPVILIRKHPETHSGQSRQRKFRSVHIRWFSLEVQSRILPDSGINDASGSAG
jgi:hypothetical protein